VRPRFLEIERGNRGIGGGSLLPLLTAPTLKLTWIFCVTPAAVTLRSPRYVLAERPEGSADRVTVVATPAATVAPTFGKRQAGPGHRHR